MIRTLAAQIKEYKKASIITPVFMILEVVFETLIPFLMASIIDDGVEAVIGALSDVDYMRNYVLQVEEAKAYFIESINSCCGEKFHAFPSNANFVLIRCEDLLTKQEILAYLERNNVFVRNVSQCESVRDCIRITVGTKEQMQLVIILFKDYISGRLN